MDAKYTNIGRITLQETETFQKLYEFARWYRNIRCAPQTVDLFLVEYGWRCLHATFQGVVVASDFSPCFAGVPFADGTNKDLGQWDSYTLSPYEYQLMAYLHDPKYRIILSPNVEVETRVKVLDPEKPTWAHTAVFTNIKGGELVVRQ